MSAIAPDPLAGAALGSVMPKAGSLISFVCPSCDGAVRMRDCRVVTYRPTPDGTVFRLEWKTLEFKARFHVVGGGLAIELLEKPGSRFPCTVEARQS
ncbi:MAG: hypothetical protein NXI03_04595 [Alphaproteobacteria bacterium]|nr:hypothetical protein [Alphaproteobacteria bacterium]